MKAVICTKYGPPEVLRIAEVPKPVPQEDEVLIKIHATSVTTSGGFLRRGDPLVARLFTGLMRPKVPILGTDLAGEIEAVGKAVSSFKEGDAVFAASDTRFGAHAEYICLPEDAAIAPKPVNMNFDEATALCEGALTALVFLRDSARIAPGTKVLVNGASGAIGSAAVQLAKYYDTVVTGVCSGRNAELVGSLGADQVIDYTREDFAERKRAYDVVFDTVGKSSFPRCRDSLTNEGLYLSPVMTVPLLLQMFWTAKFGRTRAVFAATGLRPPHEKRKDLIFLKELAEAGRLESVIDRRYSLEEVVEASRYVDQGHKRGNVVLTVA